MYAAQLIWPISKPFPNVVTAFVDVAGRAGGSWLLQLVNGTLLVATIGSGMGSQLGAARLLYAMGRSNALSRSFFAAIDSRHHIPRNNVLFSGALALIRAMVIGYDTGVSSLNFGALIAFMGVNVSSLVRYYVRGQERRLRDLLPPFCGFAICLLLWWNLSPNAKIAGTVWMLIGLVYGAYRTGGFRAKLINFEIPPEEK